MQKPINALQIEPEQVIYCPKCSNHLFVPVNVYAMVKNDTPLIGQASRLTEQLIAVQCTNCQTMIPRSQVHEFTQSNLKQLAELEANAKNRQEAEANPSEVN